LVLHDARGTAPNVRRPKGDDNRSVRSGFGEPALSATSFSSRGVDAEAMMLEGTHCGECSQVISDCAAGCPALHLSAPHAMTQSTEPHRPAVRA
jgi:hypothetical protein